MIYWPQSQICCACMSGMLDIAEDAEPCTIECDKNMEPDKSGKCLEYDERPEDEEQNEFNSSDDNYF